MITVILTGGKSSRMGRDKALLEVDGIPLALHLAERYSALGAVAFSVDRIGRFPVGRYMELVDKYPGQGPLNGLISAFEESEEDLVFLTATDMPAGTVEAVQCLLDSLGDCDACIYEGEPLFGVYKRSCLAPALGHLQAGRRSFYGLLEDLHVCQLPKEDKNIFLNLNTPADYEMYRENKWKF